MRVQTGNDPVPSRAFILAAEKTNRIHKRIMSYIRKLSVSREKEKAECGAKVCQGASEGGKGETAGRT